MFPQRLRIGTLQKPDRRPWSPSTLTHHLQRGMYGPDEPLLRGEPAEVRNLSSKLAGQRIVRILLDKIEDPHTVFRYHIRNSRLPGIRTSYQCLASQGVNAVSNAELSAGTL